MCCNLTSLSLQSGKQAYWSVLRFLPFLFNLQNQLSLFNSLSWTPSSVSDSSSAQPPSISFSCSDALWALSLKIFLKPLVFCWFRQGYFETFRLSKGLILSSKKAKSTSLSVKYMGQKLNKSFWTRTCIWAHGSIHTRITLLLILCHHELHRCSPLSFNATLYIKSVKFVGYGILHFEASQLLESWHRGAQKQSQHCLTWS